ncbi:glucosamine-6-phosphate deaminase [Paenibacillus koleovorans]|uniref:glucosamine-6-phosphate deaminase n=1 Tax=Paenibacillus koleovorans TaxID=121608 RepID=UPI0027D883BD|nr:glucosamine-6-phosphate deaminase [Paenibacillus koleovorans]
MELVDSLQVQVYETRGQMGFAAGTAVASKLRELLARQPEVRIILGSAPSQNELMDTLAEASGIDWSRVTLFHMDEYIGISAEDSHSFSHYLRERLVRRVQPGRYHVIDGTAPDPKQECRRYAGLLSEATMDIVCLGIGENGHIAFNDPPVADFEDPLRVKIVEIDAVCRQQQVNDRCFETLEDVPTHAITLTVPSLMSGTYAFGIVPGPTKTKAVHRTLDGSISTECPATIIRKHPHCTLYLDAASYGLGER